MQKFTVDRKTWYRGRGGSGSRLLRKDGMMCCLGHIGKQCGLKEKDLLNFTSPSRTQKNRSKWPTKLLTPTMNSHICMKMMRVNDEIHNNSKRREDELKKLAVEANFELEFIN